MSLPYTVEINDITIMISGQHESDAMLRRAIDAFDCLYAESVESVRVMAFGVHPYVSGAAHRIRYFGQMMDYFAAMTAWRSGPATRSATGSPRSGRSPARA